MILDKRFVIFLLGIFVLILAACASQALPGTGDEQTPAPATQPVTPGLPPEAVLEAQSWLAEQLGVPVEQVNIQDMQQAEWTDSCLGLGQPHESCAQVITPGWLVTFQVDGVVYEVRTDETGAVIRSPQLAGGEDRLANTRWTLVSFGEPGAETPVLEGTTITLEFAPGGQAGGSGGCNTYGAQYTIQDSILSFSEIVRTEIACLEEGVMQQEDSYFQALEAAGEFELSDGELTIEYGGGQGVLNFTRAPEDETTPAPGAEDPLANTSWELESFSSDGTVEMVIAGSELTLVFEGDGRAGGSGGCNSFGVEYQVEDGRLSFSELVSTLRACAEQDLNEQENSYFQALQNAGEYELAGDRLIIHYDNGAGALNFVRATPTN